MPRPNVLLLMVDQLAAGWLPAYGHDVVRAPSLDALAEQGVVFDSAYCPSPLCAPSRAALLTGRLPSRIGVYDNAAELRASEPTVTHRLRAAGYDTCLSGKMHFVGPDQLHGFEQRLTTDVYPADLDWTPDWRAPLTERLPWYHTMESVLTPGVCAASMQMDYDDEVSTARSASCTTSRAIPPDGRSSCASRSPARTTRGSCGRATGSSTTRRRSRRPRSRRSRASRPIRTASGCATCRGSTTWR